MFTLLADVFSTSDADVSKLSIQMVINGNARNYCWSHSLFLLFSISLSLTHSPSCPPPPKCLSKILSLSLSPILVLKQFDLISVTANLTAFYQKAINGKILRWKKLIYLWYSWCVGNFLVKYVITGPRQRIKIEEVQVEKVLISLDCRPRTGSLIN